MSTLEHLARVLCEANEAQVAGRRFSPDAVWAFGPGVPKGGSVYWKLFLPQVRAVLTALADNSAYPGLHDAIYAILSEPAESA